MIQLGIEAFMSVVTQIALVESKQAIWDYNPLSQGSAVVGGLDVIAIIRTLVIKVSFTFVSECYPFLIFFYWARSRRQVSVNRHSMSSRCRIVRFRNPL